MLEVEVVADASPRKKTVARGDVTSAIESTDCLAFLDGAMED